MTQLIEKDKELQSLLDTIPETMKGTKVRTLLNAAVEKAYKAGLVKFSAFDHTLMEHGERTQWVSADISFDLGENQTLIKSYLIENGYAN